MSRDPPLTMQKAQCPCCDSESFDVSDGLFFCSQCGTQSQDVRQEEDYNYGHTTLNVGHASVSKPSQPAIKKESQRWTVWEWNEAFQWILKKQVEALIDLGFDRKIKVVAAQLWFASLRQLNIAFTDKPHKESRRLFVKGEKHKQSLAQKRKRKQRGERKARERKAKVSKLAQSASDSDTTDEENEAATQNTTNEKKVSFSDKAKSSHHNTTDRKNVSFSDTLKKHSDFSSETEEKSSLWDDFSCNEEPSSPYKCSDSEYPSSDDSFSDVEIPSALKDAMKDATKKAAKNGINRPLERRAQNKCHQLLSMCSELPLAVCYVALLCLRQNVIEIDVVRWVRSQKLPYLDMTSCLPPHMQLTGLHMHLYFRPYAAPESGEISYFVKRLILLLKLPRSCIPPVDCEVVCRRFVSELLLPDHVHRIACGLLRIHTPDCILPFYYDYRNSGVGGMCMTVVVIAMKMCYGLDGEQEFSGHPPELELGWHDWVKMYTQHLVKQHRLSKPANVLNLVKDCSLYLTACDYRIPQRPRGMLKRTAKSVPHCSEIFRTLGQTAQSQTVEKLHSTDKPAVTMNERDETEIIAPGSRYAPLNKQKGVFGYGSGEVSDSYRLLIGICASHIEVMADNLHSDVVLQEQLYMQHFEKDTTLRQQTGSRPIPSSVFLTPKYSPIMTVTSKE